MKTSSSPGLPLDDGAVVGRYVIDGWVRDGGMASLYRGRHVKTGAKVAIKVQRRGGPDDDATAAARFEREGQVMGRLSGGPYVVQVHDVDELPDGRRYLVMEWIEGGDLEETLDDLRNAGRQIEVERACRLLGDVARALEAVHAARVVHRDLKPANIMIDRRRAEHETAKLLDFGISADLGVGGRAGELTAAGVVLGTAGYVAPEQALGLPADPCFDVYAFGAVAFEVLTGRRVPPEALGPERLPPVAQLRPSVPAALSELVSACLQRDPSRRPTIAGVVVGLDVIGRGLATKVKAERAGGSAGGRSPRLAPPIVHARSEAASTDAPAVGTGVSTAGRHTRWIAALLGLAIVVAVAVRSCGSERVVNGAGVVGTESGVEVGRLDLGVGIPKGETTGTAAVESLAGPSSGSSFVVEASDAPPSEPAGEPTTEPPGEAASGTEDDVAGVEPRDPKRSPSIEDPSPEQCERLRRQTAVANESRDWSGLLRATADARCWATKDQRNGRKALRVEALAELGRYAQCVREGAGSTDPRVASRTKVCRLRIREGSE